MSDHPSGSTTLLRLPPEIRREIFTALFRSITFHSHRPSKKYLAILQVCRQVYHEAASLVLPNARVYCRGNAAMLDTLGRMAPAQIMQLRHLIVSHSPVGFKLDMRAEDRRAGDIPDEDDGWASETENDASYWEEDAEVRYFDLGGLLGLFPGLRLDLLEVFSGKKDDRRYVGHMTTGCFGSLLEADGYRRLWMHAAAGDEGQPWVDTLTTERWSGAIERRFKPYAGWRVQIGLREGKFDDRLERELWDRALKDGITLVEADYDERGAGDDDAEGHGGEEVADIVVDRGHAVDFAVKEGDGQVLRCIVVGFGRRESPRFFRRASDALRKLVRESGWGAIKVIDVYDVSSYGSIEYCT